MSRPKIALIGGGQVGGNIALLSAQKELGDIVILDIPEAENFMKGKALDISQLLPLDGYDSKLSGTSNFEDIKNSDVVVITAGFPRKPGMDRADLLSKKFEGLHLKHLLLLFLILLMLWYMLFIKFQVFRKIELWEWPELLIAQDLELSLLMLQIYHHKMLIVWFLEVMEIQWYQLVD